MPLASMRPSDIHQSSLHVSSSGISSLDDMLILEQPLLRLPVDELRTQLKTQQRLSERDFLHCGNALDSSLKRPLDNGNKDAFQPINAVTQRLSLLRERVCILRSYQLADLGVQASTLLQYTQARTEYLNLLDSLEPGSQSFHDWCSIRLDRMVVDYMLRRSAFQSAKLLATQQQITSLVDLPVFEQIRKIELSLVPDEGEGMQPTCTTALAWCSENKVTLRKAKSTLEFDLRLQEFIEQVRNRSTTSLLQATQYARKHFLPWLHTRESTDEPSTTSWTSKSSKTTHSMRTGKGEQPHLQQQALRAMGLLAAGPESWCYHDLYDPRRWKVLRDSFRSIALQVYDLPPSPLIHIALSAGLSSIKSHSCFSTKAKKYESFAANDSSLRNPSALLAENMELDNPSKSDDRHPDCPICHTRGLGTLAREVPYSHQGMSRLICRITGKVMDDTNPPMVLPNGRVYSEEVRMRQD